MSTKKENPVIDYDSFRDSFATVDQEGKRKWIYPKMPKGRLHNKRVIVSIILLALMFIGPFLRWKGAPMFLFNILERKFIIFGVPFWPQDFHLLALAIITFFVFIILFTAIFGRVWCGWACPQTIFMEMVFRKIEYWIEGDAPKQKKLTRQPWNREKILKRGGKWLIFAILAFLIGNLVMAYIIGTDELSKLVTEGPAEHWGKFSFVLIFSGIFFFVFAYFREQACLVICPYGRLQSALLDRDSVVVHYDDVRGEPRGRGRDRSELGDCIDCHQCVTVCPTGIDIRNGTQMECVNCTACIDACDEIMDKVNKPRGLVRFASTNMVEEQKGFKITPRIIAYAVVLTLLSGVLITSLAMRSTIEATVLRARGTLYSLSEDKQVVTNIYQLQIANKTHQSFGDIEVRLLEPEGGKATLVGKELHVDDQGLGKGSVLVEIPRSILSEMKTPIKLGFYSGETELDIVKTKFMGPGN
ncbi:MAG: cytochrome c oxidase accessory protein CcoG [Bacteroidia bacterium]